MLDELDIENILKDIEENSDNWHNHPELVEGVESLDSLEDPRVKQNTILFLDMLHQKDHFDKITLKPYGSNYLIQWDRGDKAVEVVVCYSGYVLSINDGERSLIECSCTLEYFPFVQFFKDVSYILN